MSVPDRSGSPLFSICTLVNDHARYAGMCASFARHGFDAANSEFLHLDNSGGNRWDGYAGLAALLDRAKGRYVVLCHQDVLLVNDGAAELASCLASLEASAPNWALAGNGGSTGEGKLAIRITDPWGVDAGRGGAYPVRVVSLDENFIVVRAASGIRPSAALSGFHLYGTDLCLQAERAGCSAWVVDFHLKHTGRGTVDASFLDAQVRLEKHWGQIFGETRRIRTPCTQVTLRRGMEGHVRAAAWMAKRRTRLLLRRLALLATGRRTWYDPLFSARSGPAS